MMRNITIFTKRTQTDGQYRISNMIDSDAQATDINVINAVFVLFALLGKPEAQINNNFAYSFGFNLGG